MNETTLALSELAGRVDVAISSADDPTTIAAKIVSRFEEAKPLELSEREKPLIRSMREVKLQRLLDRGLAPAIQNRLVLAYCSDDLSLSEDNENFDLVCSIVEDVLDQKIISLAEETKAQVLAAEANKPAPIFAGTKDLKPV